MAEAHLGDVRGLKALEVGCGRGAFAELLVDRGAAVTAADASKVAVDETRKRLAGRGEVVVADAHELPFPDERFDLVICLETLEHLGSVGRGISELVRVTRPGGRLIITSPNYVSPVGLRRLLRRLARKPSFEELGQPVNHVTTVHGLAFRLWRRGCRLETVLTRPNRRRNLGRLDRVPGFRLFGLRGLIVATRR